MLTPSQPRVMIHDSRAAELHRILYLVHRQLLYSWDAHYLTLFPEEEKPVDLFSLQALSAA